ncbi:hypothetical protein [Saccharomonospora viridis]|jgi:hypothetical protein|uniref:Uncharacterized protein n=2 Tax=Saccharomonospora viridis TaxID=1852 RepID=C7MT20_SACVD|nr:hypothetical protein [Saccharomonospora viridis]ACU95381.1 hypothetical protein Svir_02990 [Saccharomonospora viridis DSM 43017]KHF45013.1 hypothetical protein MINT15_18950 [Saccharomonospora viridis]SFP15532.1 hypothetical protein SAMN02982918_1434 [Saccharomonospora viridis]
MLYLLAAIGAATVAFLLWRALGADRIGVSSSSRQAPVAPDDDPEFLRRISEQQRRQRNTDEDGTN